MENHPIHYLEIYTSSEIIAQATTFTTLVVVPASFFRNIPLFPLSNCFDYGCKVIYYIGTAIRANGDLPKDWHSANLNHWLRLILALLADASAKASC